MGQDIELNIDTITYEAIRTVLWTSSCNGTAAGVVGHDCMGEDCDTLLADIGFQVHDLDDQARRDLKVEVQDFVLSNADTLTALRAEHGVPNDMIGYDLVLTRNDEGAGFWDRGYGALGDKLTDSCRPYGGISAYAGDNGKLYLQS